MYTASYLFDLARRALNQEKVWEELLPQLRCYVELRQWNITFLVTHLHQQPQTIGGWLVNVRPPTVDCLVALWFMLYEFGFPLVGVSKLDETVCFAGRLFAFGVASQQEILRNFFDLKSSTHATLYRILRGEQTPRSIIEVPRYQPQLTESICRAIELEQQATKALTTIRQAVGAA